MRGRRDIMRGIGGGTTGQDSAPTTTTTSSSAPLRATGRELPPAVATTERGRPVARAATPTARAPFPKMPDYSPVTWDTSARREHIGPMRREDAAASAVPARVPVAAPALKPSLPTNLHKRAHNTSAAAAASLPKRKSPFPNDLSIMTPNFEKNHIVRLPGKDKSKSKDAGRAEIEEIFRQEATQKGKRVGIPARPGEVTKNTVYGFTPKKMERWHKTLAKDRVQEALENHSRSPITIKHAKVRKATFERGKDPVFKKYKERDIKVANSRHDPAEHGGVYRYPLDHLPDSDEDSVKSFQMAKKKREGSKKKKDRR